MQNATTITAANHSNDVPSMSEITEILAAVERGESADTDRLLPIVYAELRRIATSKLARETPGITLQTTGLVHEAYLRLVGTPVRESNSQQQPTWDSKAHFFSAAAEAMRRILIEHARRKRQLKRGGPGRQRLDLDHVQLADEQQSLDLLALDEALNKLEADDPTKAQVVKLRYFAGLTIEETAKAMGISTPTVKRYWFYARAWLQREISQGDDRE